MQDSLTAGRPFRLLLRAYCLGLSLTHKAFTLGEIMLRISSLTSVGADVGEVVGEDVGPFLGEAEGASVAGSGASVGEVVGDFVDGPNEGT